MSPLRLLLVDDQPLFREGLRSLLSLQPDLVVVAEAGDGAAAVRAAVDKRPDVVLMDLRMPGLDGVAATTQLRTACPTARVIILTTFDDDEYVFEGLRAGAVGYLLKDVPSADLCAAIRAAARGQGFLQPSVTAKVVAEFARLSRPTPRQQTDLAEPLTERELAVLGLLVRGASNREIAAALVITEGTAKNHVTSILAKLAVRDRTQAALKARDLGLV